MLQCWNSIYSTAELVWVGMHICIYQEEGVCLGNHGFRFGSGNQVFSRTRNSNHVQYCGSVNGVTW